MKTLRTILAITSLGLIAACAQTREAAVPSDNVTVSELDWAIAQPSGLGSSHAAI